MITYKQFIKKYKGKVVPFAKLPLSYQLAMIRYMAFDGEAWEVPEESDVVYVGDDAKNLAAETKWIKKNLPYWVKKYGKQKFGMMEVPMKDFCKIVYDNFNFHNPEEFKSFKEYHKWYVGACLWKNSNKHYSEIWPAILDCERTYTDGRVSKTDWEVLQDGNHRFHTYVELGKKTMPLIYYP